jgi:hypothetical protein
MHPLSVQRPRIAGLLACLAACLPGVARADVFARPVAGPGRLDAEVAWEIQLPGGQTRSFLSYHLLEGRIYAMGVDGSVVAVWADTGRIAWIRKLAGEFDALWPPVVYRTQAAEGVVFTRLNEVILVDAKTGVPMGELDLNKPSIGTAAVAPGRVFVAQPGSRLACYRLKDHYVFWRAAFDDELLVPPVYAPAVNQVIVVDNSGLVAGLKNIDRAESRVAFKQNLRSTPEGALAVDGDMLYLATVNQMLHAIHLPTSTKGGGNLLWQYRLARPPEGGPLLGPAAIYQATRSGGLYRLPREPGEFAAWFDPQGRQMLAEWPQGTLLFRTDGSLALVKADPAHPVALGPGRGYRQGISNCVNDAVYLTSPDGRICCLRPAQAPPLKLASFLPNAAASAPEEPTDETALERLRREAREKQAAVSGKSKPRTSEEKVTSGTPTQSQPAEAAAAPGASPEPYDPLRSGRPIVK